MSRGPQLSHTGACRRAGRTRYGESRRDASAGPVAAAGGWGTRGL